MLIKNKIVERRKIEKFLLRTTVKKSGPKIPPEKNPTNLYPRNEPGYTSHRPNDILTICVTFAPGKKSTPKKMIQQVRAKKHLGQHFLTDLNIASRIASSLPDGEAKPTLEIGPGMGVLTQFLMQRPELPLSVVEIDTESVAYLHEHYPQLRVIEGDFLKMNLSEQFPATGGWVIGNFPYNISSQIFFKVLEYKDLVPCCVGMIQKEVAERLAEPPGSKTYGILSVLLQTYYHIEYLFTVGAHVFSPPPKVQSAVIRLTRNSRTSIGCNEKLFVTVVKTAFNQRRKQLRNSLKPLVGKESGLLTDPIFDKRPEQLGVEDFIGLTKMISESH